MDRADKLFKYIGDEKVVNYTVREKTLMLLTLDWADKHPVTTTPINNVYHSTAENDFPVSSTETVLAHINDAGCKFYDKLTYDTSKQEWHFQMKGRLPKYAVDYWMTIPEIPDEKKN